MSRWTQPICNDCWDDKHSDKPSPRVNQGDEEQCSYCGKVTVSGIYVRDDPATVPYPPL